jgi:hypothetical protein
LLRGALRRIAADPSKLANCSASQALKMAIWSDKSHIPTDEIKKLHPLWGRYFS